MMNAPNLINMLDVEIGCILNSNPFYCGYFVVMPSLCFSAHPPSLPWTGLDIVLALRFQAGFLSALCLSQRSQLQPSIICFSSPLFLIRNSNFDSAGWQTWIGHQMMPPEVSLLQKWTLHFWRHNWRLASCLGRHLWWHPLWVSPNYSSHHRRARISHRHRSPRWSSPLLVDQ